MKLLETTDRSDVVVGSSKLEPQEKQQQTCLHMKSWDERCVAHHDSAGSAEAGAVQYSDGGVAANFVAARWPSSGVRPLDPRSQMALVAHGSRKVVASFL